MRWRTICVHVVAVIVTVIVVAVIELQHWTKGWGLDFIKLHWIRFGVIITLEHQTLCAFFLSVFIMNKTKITVYAIASCNLEIYKIQLPGVTQRAITIFFQRYSMFQWNAQFVSIKQIDPARRIIFRMLLWAFISTSRLKVMVNPGCQASRLHRHTCDGANLQAIGEMAPRQWHSALPIFSCSTLPYTSLAKTWDQLF